MGTQPHITVDMNMVEDTLEELFSAHVEVECEAHRAKTMESQRQRHATSVFSSIAKSSRERQRWKTGILSAEPLGVPQNVKHDTKKQQRKRPRIAIGGDVSHAVSA